jgi:hypothetical protein
MLSERAAGRWPGRAPARLDQMARSDAVKGARRCSGIRSADA